MFGFGRKHKKTSPQNHAETADTFVEATGGGWNVVPDVVADDGGSQKGFVEETLERAYQYALEHDVPVGETFTYAITDIPVGISSPHEITFGLMMQADRYGLSCEAIANETASFIRLK